MFNKETQEKLLNAISQDMSLFNRSNNYAFKLEESDFQDEYKKWYQLICFASKEGYKQINEDTVKLFDPQLNINLQDTKSPETDFLNGMKVFEGYKSAENFKNVSGGIIEAIKHTQLNNVIHLDKAKEEIAKLSLGYQRTTNRWNSGSALHILDEDYNYEEDNGRIPTYLEEVDDVLGDGFYRGGTHVISGFPHGGKTTLAIQIATLQAAHGYKVLYCSLEQRRVDILENALSVLAEQEDQNRSYWEVGKLKDLKDQSKKKTEARSILEKYVQNNLHIDDTQFEDEDQFIARIRVAVEVEGFDIIYIDNFQNSPIFYDQASRFGRLSQELLKIAVKNKTPIVCLSQLTSDGKGGAKTKYAAKLNEDAVSQLRVYREAPEDKDGEEQAPDVDMIYINIAKNRKGRGFLKEDLSFIFNGAKSVIGTLNLPKRTSTENFINGIKIENEKIVYKGRELPF